MAGDTVYLTNRVPIPSPSYQGSTVYLSDGVGQGTYLIRWLDRLGNVVASSTGDAGQSFSAPAVPTVSGLTNGRWSEAATLITRDMDILPLYDTADGKGHVFIQASALLGLTATVKATKTDGSTLLIEWGDGTTDTSTATGAVTVTHLYAAGSYEAKFSISVGTGEFSMGHGTTGNPFIAGVSVTELWMRSTSTSIPAYSINGTAFRTMAAIVGANGATAVGANALQSCYELSCAPMPLVASIGATAFRDCHALRSAWFPSATSIGATAFQSCFSIGSALFPVATSMGANAFQGCVALLTASFPLVTSIGDAAFLYCIALPTASFPSVTSIGVNSFQNCFSLTSISLPLVTSIGDTALQFCYAISAASFPSVTSIGVSSFQTMRLCTSLQLGPNCASIGSLALESVRTLRTLRIEAVVPPALASVASLADFDPRLIIQVPAASLAAYQAATNWSSFSARMVGV